MGKMYRSNRISLEFWENEGNAGASSFTPAYDSQKFVEWEDSLKPTFESMLDEYDIK